MTDVTVAPPGSAPSAAHEVPIDQNPIQTPSPISNQPPDKPVGDLKGSEHRPQSRREAIQAAFDKANNPPPKTARPAERPAPKAAEAKPGHNNPPEPTEPERLDLKKRPADQPQRERGEGGRFAPRQDSPVNPAIAGPDGQQRKPAPQLPENAPFRDPPVRMADHAKAEWANAPESVRGEVHRMQREFEGAYQQYRGAHEAFQPIAHFHQMAQEHGTTLERALTNYVGMEQKLRQDVIGGLDVIVNNLGLKTPDGQRLGLRDIAYHVLSQSPEQLQQLQQGNAQTAASYQIGALHQEIAGLKQTLQQWQTAQQFSYTRSAVDQFAADHPRFDELGDLIERELQFGFDLPTAYRRAELLRPATHAAQTRTQSAQTRPIDRSISGAPAGPSNGTGQRSTKPVGRREAIARAFKHANGGL